MTGSPLRLRLLWLTLFAFGVQILVADFHHHTVHGKGIQARAMTAGMCSRLPAHPCVPADKDHDGCVLCWATAIAATSLTPVLFDLPERAASVGQRFAVSDFSQRPVAHLTDVRARGPPHAALG